MRDAGEDILDSEADAEAEVILRARLVMLKRVATAAGYDVRSPGVQAALINSYQNICLVATVCRSLDRCGDYLRNLARRGER